MDVKFYKCMHCGNIAVKVFDAGVPLVCCGEKMVELVAGSQDAALEKHVPAVEVETPLKVYEHCNLHGLWVTEI